MIAAFVVATGSAQIVTTVPGSATCCAGAANGITRDTQGNLYVWTGSAKIVKLTPAGVVTTVAGGTTSGHSGDGGPATSAQIFGGNYSGLAIDAAGDLYLSDTYNHSIRMVNGATGIITTVAGTGAMGFSGDSGPATKAQLNYPAGIALDSSGNLYIADEFNSRVRKVNSSGVISTFAGNGGISYGSDGGQASATAVVRPQGVTLDSAGDLYISETDQNRIRKVTSGGVIGTVAGKTSGSSGFSGDGGPAASAVLFGPLGMAVDSSGNLFFADNQNQRIRMVNAGGFITTYAGTLGNASTPIGEGGPALSAYLGTPIDMVLGPSGTLYFTDSLVAPDSVRQIAPAAGLSTTPASLAFNATPGGAAPATQTLSVTSSGAAMTFTALASTTTGGSWLTVSPGSGTTPANLTISVNPAGLSTGSYQGLVTLTPAGASALPVAVTLTITGAGAPAITPGGIVNATGYQTTLAPDTVFVIFGSNLGPAALQSAPGPGYPTSYAGTSIAFTPTTGGAAIPAKLVYTSAGIVAGLLPSSIAPGTYNVTVGYNSQTSTPQSVTVAARSFGIATSNSAGTGEAQATIANVNGGLSLVRLTSGSVAFSGYTWTLTPAHPGDTVVLWGTGGGADPANDTGGSSGDQTAAGNFSVNVDGTAITPLYAGASPGYPGLWQINFTLPATIAADCFATVQVSAGGQLSNLVTIAIAPAGQSSCSSTISAATLSKLDNGGNIVMAGLVVGRTTSIIGSSTTITESVGGVFNQYTAAGFLIPYSGPKVGACMVMQEQYAAGASEPSGPTALLNAGTLKVTGPSLNASIPTFNGPNGPAYIESVASGTLQNGATYTLTGSGGTQIGPFSATATMPTSFTVTNLSSLTVINRAQPLTVNWTGSGFDEVHIIIIGDILTTTATQAVSISCVAPAGAGTYTIPAAAMAYLPAVVAGSQNSGQIGISASPSVGGTTSAESSTSTLLTPPLVAGGTVDFGAFSSFIEYVVSATIQ